MGTQREVLLREWLYMDFIFLNMNKPEYIFLYNFDVQAFLFNVVKHKKVNKTFIKYDFENDHFFQVWKLNRKYKLIEFNRKDWVES